MTPIPHSRPTLPEGVEWSEVTDALAPGWAADGPCVERFAREAAEVLGRTHGFAVSSGTSALHLALLAAGVEPGDEVLIPAYCCAALLNAVALARAVPVLVDSEPGGYNICPEDAARRRSGRAAAVVVAHMFGRPAPLGPFLALDVPVIEDCAQSFGAPMAEPGGGIALASFYATKVITTGQGGLVATSDPRCAQVLADLLQYDNRDDWRPRFNYGMGETSAALGLWQLRRLDSFLKSRRALAARYDQSFHREPAPGISYRYLLRCQAAEAAIQRFQAAGIQARRPVYRPLHHYLGGDFPQAEAAHRETVSLPIYPTLAPGDQESIIKAALETKPPMW